MKKLIVAAAITVACVIQAQAVASLTWTSGGTDSSGNMLAGQAYLFLITDPTTFAIASDLSYTGATLFDNAGFDGGMAGGVKSIDAELSAGQTYQFAILLTTDGTGASLPTTGFYYVDNNGGNATGSGFYEATWDAAGGAGLTPDWGTFAGYVADNPVTAVPEPTSGLLLLLGVAGLALKRRRA